MESEKCGIKSPALCNANKCFFCGSGDLKLKSITDYKTGKVFIAVSCLVCGTQGKFCETISDMVECWNSCLESE